MRIVLWAICLAVLLFVPELARADGGMIVAWGDNTLGACNVPAPDSGFVAVSGGGNHSLGLKSNGSIVAWGDNLYGESDVPAPDSGFVAVAAGGIHSLGLKADGTIVSWGSDGYGLGVIPQPDSGFAAIAAGSWHSVALRGDSSVVAWGDNFGGQCNVPPPNTGFVAISAGHIHSVGLKTDGSIVAWGDNADGQCNIPSPNAGFVAVAAGDFHNLGLKADGSIVAWGRNNRGQCNVPEPNTGFTAVAARWDHNLGLKEDGSIRAWGTDFEGESGLPDPNDRFQIIAAGGLFSLAIGPHRLYLGACCSHEGTCAYTLQADCTPPDVWHGPATNCSPGPCTEGSCCFLIPFTECRILEMSACLAQNGVFNGYGADCDASPMCPAAGTPEAGLGAQDGFLGAVPNPFLSSASLRYRLAAPSQVAVEVLDASGRVIRRLLDGRRPAGESTLTWDGKDDGGTRVSAGVYLIRVKAGAEATTGKIVLAR